MKLKQGDIVELIDNETTRQIKKENCIENIECVVVTYAKPKTAVGCLVYCGNHSVYIFIPDAKENLWYIRRPKQWVTELYHKYYCCDEAYLWLVKNNYKTLLDAWLDCTNVGWKNWLVAFMRDYGIIKRKQISTNKFIKDLEKAEKYLVIGY